ncbi:MAG: hypothetical protein HOP29_13765 [Phycisphaerales bacterium]|nr:hypothetical protein [Phycisphaerales bacterium]
MPTDQKPTPIVVLFSGGINSTAAAARYTDGSALHFLHVNHGQPAAAAERETARRITDAMAGTLHVADLSFSTAGGKSASATKTGKSSDTDDATDDVSSAKQIDEAASGLMFSLVGLAQRLAHRVGAETITCGVSQICDEQTRSSRTGCGDPQRGRIFHRALAIALEMSLTARHRVAWETPFIDSPRIDIVRAGMRLGAPFHLSWSCDSTGPKPCERCRGCRSRAEAFESVGQADPRLAVAR